MSAGLTAINAALQDPVTGLRALNLARPKFAVITTTPDNPNGTPPTTAGAAVGGSRPDFGGVTRVAEGVYVLNVGQDVSKRAPQLSVNVPRLPAGPTVNLAGIGQILNCGASDGSRLACAGVGVTAADAPSRVLVSIENATESGAPRRDGFTFTATEIAG